MNSAIKENLSKKLPRENKWEGKWQVGIAIFSLMAMLLYGIFYLLGVGLGADIIRADQVSKYKILSASSATFDFWLHYAPLLLAIIIASPPLCWRILRDLFRGNFGADLLALIALVVAVLLQEFLAANLIIFMLASGQALENYATRKASSVLLALASRMPSLVHLKRGEAIEEIDITAVKIADEIVIYPHETCPVDGLVLEGHSQMDESYLTGEPYKISKAPGSLVLSGAINGDSVLLVRADKLPTDSRYAKIMQVMKEAEGKRPQLRRLADQIGSVFTPLALAIAALAWFISGDLTRFLSVLVVATPCPLLIAVPVTIISAISLAARRGIIIKDPIVLERLPTCRTAIFDKTGTLTRGQPEVTDIKVAQGFNANVILQQIASLERYSRHPLAGAILRYAEVKHLPLLSVERLSERPGQGLEGFVEKQKINVTSRKKLVLNDPKAAELLPKSASGLECVILVNDQYAALIRFHDVPRADGHSFISHLGPSHKIDKVILLSGDRESEVKYLADLLGIEKIYASQSPEQKVEIVRAENAKAPVLFMGDGINDAPALAVATVGLAFGQNNNVTSEAAGAVIMDNSLAKVDELIHISMDMRRIAAQSAIGGMLFSVIGMMAAAFGLINPVQGALLQELIDVVAILAALRMTWQPNIVIDLPAQNSRIVH